MGHYYTDLACDHCGQLRCRCNKPIPGLDDNDWIIADDFSIVKAGDYQRSKPYMGYFDRLAKPHFKMKEDAEQEALKLLDSAISASQKDLKTFKKLKAKLLSGKN